MIVILMKEIIVKWLNILNEKCEGVVFGGDKRG